MSPGLFFLLFNLQKFIHELGHYLMAKRAGIVVEEFGIGYPPRIAELGQRNGTTFTLNWLLFGSFIKMVGEKDATIPGSFASKSKLSRLSVLIVGPLLNLMTMCILIAPAIIFFTLAYMSGVSEPVTGININGEEASVVTTIINNIEPDSPAEKVGLQSNDIIIGADEVQFKYAGDLVVYVEKMKGREITLLIERENQLIEIPIIPRPNPPEGQGGMGVGIIYEDVRYKMTYHSFPTAFIKGVVSTIENGWRTIYIPFIVFRDIILKEEMVPSRPIGPFQNDLILPPTTAVERTQWFPIFYLLGVLSAVITFPIVLVTAISFLPLPRWDNWRIIGLIFER